jgi:hypothetical protein
MNLLVAHCPTQGCYMRVPVATVATDTAPEFDPTLYVVVICHSCGKEFRELASLLDLTPQSEVTGKFISRRRSVNP